jgi:hypothetical protein
MDLFPEMHSPVSSRKALFPSAGIEGFAHEQHGERRAVALESADAF